MHPCPGPSKIRCVFELMKYWFWVPAILTECVLMMMLCDKYKMDLKKGWRRNLDCCSTTKEGYNYFLDTFFLHPSLKNDNSYGQPFKTYKHAPLYPTMLDKSLRD